MTVRLDLKLGTLTFKPDHEPHILIDTELCRSCAERPCTIVCPAGLYVWDDGQMVHNCEGCLECGSCRAVCPHGGHWPARPLIGHSIRGERDGLERIAPRVAAPRRCDSRPGLRAAAGMRRHR